MNHLQSYVKGSSFWVLPTAEHQRQQGRNHVECDVECELVIQWFRPRNKASGVTSSRSHLDMKSLARPRGSHFVVTINRTQCWLARGAGSSSKTTKPIGSVTLKFEINKHLQHLDLWFIRPLQTYISVAVWCSIVFRRVNHHIAQRPLAPSKWWSELIISVIQETWIALRLLTYHETNHITTTSRELPRSSLPVSLVLYCE